jgi:hypothetical protein
MSDNKIEEAGPPGDAATEILDGRIWIDGCFDFFHQYVSRSLKFFGGAEFSSTSSPFPPIHRSTDAYVSVF